ncbi:RNA-binding protein 7 [Toxorhynchites rutilus septentrionalis]|uniref:RNA-binding protein 7 n=1 Tax=Toxorhynchites rutilus septentrionalis TaxID=329112 RepID=UPI00247A5D9E|nr:RNA-binding protein 7 [Toxorhynchites rutilus septentrionalis]
MSEEDDRTLWCGNLSDKANEELLYELFLQAGPIEMVKIPRDNDKRPRSYAFITYAHAASVEYAIDIFEGTKLFQRPLTLHKKSKNNSNSSASPKGNFNNNNQQQNRGQQRHSNDKGQFNISPNMMNQMMTNVKEMVDQFNRQAHSGSGPMQQNPLLANKSFRNDRQHHQQNPYSRGEREDNDQAFSRNRNSREWGPNGRNRGSGGGGNQRRSDYRGRRSFENH